MKKLFILIFLPLTFSMCNSPVKEKEPETTIQNNTNKVVLSSEIKWEQLNPARGENSPKAGTIWGDRKGTVPTGFLAKFKDGFSSPPHIHNVTYRAMVIKGLIHNDDADAENMWMPSGSFWTQPAGAAHITSAKEEENMIYVEIDSGPYLVKPIEEAFDNGERPVNVDASNIVWLDADNTSVIENNKAGVAFLWEKNDLKGNIIKLPVGFNGKIKSDGSIFHAIVIQGNPAYFIPNVTEGKNLDPGSYFTSEGDSVHELTIQDQETTIYIRTNGGFKVIQ